MTSPALNPPPLPSEIFYRSVRTYRNRRTFIVLGVSLVCATPFVLGVINHLTGQRTGSLPVPILYLGAALFLFPACVLASCSIRNIHERIKIDQQGVRIGHHFSHWNQIKSLAPKKVNFATKYFIRVHLRVPPHARFSLYPDQPFTRSEYTELIARLKPFLEARYPAVHLKSI
jgi:hypothetical protein